MMAYEAVYTIIIVPLIFIRVFTNISAKDIDWFTYFVLMKL